MHHRCKVHECTLRHPVDTAFQSMLCREASGARFVAASRESYNLALFKSAFHNVRWRKIT